MLEWWFPGFVVGLLLVAAGVAVWGWRWWAHGHREDRREARRQGRGDHDPKKGAP